MNTRLLSNVALKSIYQDINTVNTHPFKIILNQEIMMFPMNAINNILYQLCEDGNMNDIVSFSMSSKMCYFLMHNMLMNECGYKSMRDVNRFYMNKFIRDHYDLQKYNYGKEDKNERDFVELLNQIMIYITFNIKYYDSYEINKNYNPQTLKHFTDVLNYCLKLDHLDLTKISNDYTNYVLNNTNSWCDTKINLDNIRKLAKKINVKFVLTYWDKDTPLMPYKYKYISIKLGKMRAIVYYKY